ncbi:uncharacterized protein LOC127283630 isoform X2 [Leptopilina boulardi]|uniref:uncharacterized protein LOC127283630 isoform X2 n=1 Tax=Leptopilina boulardi TaxID=63433 RepID=UPI0021F68829|nr:uncharacterized protein LOC127283630 isoform X2 [Leptopilina boulardi]
MESTTWIILLNLSCLLVNGHYQNANHEHWMRQVPRRPVDVMTDVINSLGINILQQYHVPGNVAFSPTGLGFVLIALYEGSAGRGSKQIADCLQLPHDRQITRIGLRDIHRRLRSYLNADGFLGGLNLNKDNTRLRPEFEDILRFYGFDFTIDNSQMNATDATTVNINDNTTMAGDMMNTTQTNTNGMMTMLTDGAANQANSTSGGNNGSSTTGTPGTDGSSTVVTSTTTGASAAATTISPAGANPLMSDGASATTPMNPPPTTIDTSVDIISVTPNNSAIRQSTNSSVTSSSSSTAGSLDTPLGVTDSPGRLSTTSVSSAGAMTTMTNFDDSSESMAPISVGQFNSATGSEASNELETPTESLTSMRMETTTFGSRSVPARSTSFRPTPVTFSSRPSLSTLRSTTSDKFQTSSRILDSITSTMRKPRMSTSTRLLPVTTTLKTSTTDISTSTNSDRNSEATSIKTSRSTDIVTSSTTDVPSSASTNLPITITTNNIPTITKTDVPINFNTDIPTTNVPSTIVADSGLQTETEPTIELPSSNNVRKRRSVEHYFSTYPDDGLWMQHLNIWRPPQETEEATVRDSKQVGFLVNGCDVASVSAATYTAVLPFAYFPSLKAVAVEFPLDNPRYNVILFLPTERPDTLRLAIDLGSKSLRLLRKHLQPTWIRATIPSFMLKGFVTLTPYLQRLGIRDVFEPRAADLSPMTPDIGVYARDVQQSIGVNIRNYMEPDRTSSRNGLLERAGPVSFVAEHPFLYFIIDTETTATLIAGRIDDPLNSRIL